MNSNVNFHRIVTSTLAGHSDLQKQLEELQTLKRNRQKEKERSQKANARMNSNGVSMCWELNVRMSKQRAGEPSKETYQKEWTDHEHTCGYCTTIKQKRPQQPVCCFFEILKIMAHTRIWSWWNCLLRRKVVAKVVKLIVANDCKF